MGLEADNMVYGAVCIVPAKLHHGVAFTACTGIPEANRLQGAVAESVHTASRPDLNRHTAFKDTAVVKAVNLRLLGVYKLSDKAEILLLSHRAVYIIRSPLVVTGGKEGAVHVHTFQSDNRGHSIVKVQVAVGAERSNALRYGIGA